MYESLYNRNISDLLEDNIERRCFYCGMPADTKDHVIPQVILKELEDILKHPIKNTLRI